MAPFFLKYVKKPTIYYCQQPPRTEAILKIVSKAIQKDKKSLKDKIFYTIDKRAYKRELKIDKQNTFSAKYILANSYFSRESILKTYGLNSFVSYLGIDTNIFKPIKTRNEDFVLSVGTCTPSKGHDFIIRSLSLIEAKIRPNFVLVSNVSDIEWENYLKELAIKCNVNLEIMKLIEDKQLVELYNMANIVVYAPYLEPFGLVPIESMGCGTPVVGIKEGGVRETVIHNETGLLTERDENQFAEAVKKIMKNESKLHKMSRNSLEIVNKLWTLEQAGKRLENHLNRATNF
jgi:glycosyltransferase involved in cell wall biosynthesis